MQKIAKILAPNFIHVWFLRPLFLIMLFISYLSIIKTLEVENTLRSFSI